MKKYWWIPLVLLAVVLGIFLAFRPVDDSVGDDTTTDRQAADLDAAASKGGAPASGVELGTSPSDLTAAIDQEPEVKPEPAARSADPKQSANADAVDYSHLGDEFQADEVETVTGPIYLDFGSYKVRAGEEFDVSIRLSAPSLESVCLYMKYDPELVEGIPASAKKVGQTFRAGIEYYTRKRTDFGEAVIINESRPGSRNLNPSHGEVAVTFRMRALKAGVAQLEFPKELMSFSTAMGDDRDDYEIRGGRIEVLP